MRPMLAGGLRSLAKTRSHGAPMILAGDIGGTKALLLLAALRQGRLEPVLERRYAVASFPGFSAMLARFLEECRQHRGRDLRLASACFGAAGPVSDDCIQMTNLPWRLDAGAIAAEFGIGRVLLVNDFEAAALGIERWPPATAQCCSAANLWPGAARVVIGAGSGLGVAYALPQGKRYQVIAGEGGHAGFAPADDEQMRLWQALHAQFGRVSVEHVVSGPGLVRIYDSCAPSCRRRRPCASVRATKGRPRSAAMPWNRAIRLPAGRSTCSSPVTARRQAITPSP